MSVETRKLAGVLLVLLPTVLYGGVSLLGLLVGGGAYVDNALRRSLWRAGHAHAGVLLVLSLVSLLYVDQANLSEGLKRWARSLIPLSALLLPAAFFLSVTDPGATEPNALINLAYLGALCLAAGLLILGIGLLRGDGRGDRG